MTENTGGTISVTKKFAGHPITVTIVGDELDERALPDAIHAALDLCDKKQYSSAMNVSCYLYSVLRKAFNVVSVEVQDENREGQV